MVSSFPASAPRSGASTPRIVVAWALVGIPLAYGIAMTLTRVMALFSG